MSETRQDWAARILGMRPVEVVNLVSRGEVHLVTLHDRTRAVIDDAGRFSFDPARVDEFVTAVTVLDPPADDQEQTPPAGDDVVPDGTAEAVLAWVGDDVDRARRALAAEGHRAKPRAGVTTKLTELIGQAPPAGDGA